MALLKIFDVVALWNGNLLSSILTNIANVDKTHRMWLMWVLGLVQIVVYFVVFTVLIKKFNYHTPGREGDPLPAGAVPAEEPAPEPAAVAAATAVSSTAAPASDMPAGDTEAMNIINGLGGKANILSLENCITRLRVTMADPSLLDESLINRTVNSGIVKKGSDVQIIYGLRVADVKRDVEEQLEKL